MLDARWRCMRVVVYVYASVASVLFALASYACAGVVCMLVLNVRAGVVCALVLYARQCCLRAGIVCAFVLYAPGRCMRRGWCRMCAKAARMLGLYRPGAVCALVLYALNESAVCASG